MSVVDSFCVVLLEWLILVVKDRDVTHVWPVKDFISLITVIGFWMDITPWRVSQSPSMEYSYKDAEKLYVCIPHKFICWNLILNEIVFGDRAFGR